MSLLRHHQLLMSSSSQSGVWNSTVANLPGLWAWYQLDELAGAVTAADSSGNGRDGTYTAAGVRATPGIFSGSAAYRSSLGGRIGAPRLPISSSPQFSIVAWIIPDSVGTIQSIVSADRSGDARVWQFRLDGSKNLEFITFIGPSAAHTMSTAPVQMTPGAPAMVAATYDHGGPVRKAMYINGAQAATTLDGTLFPISTTAPTAIGSRHTLADQELWGGGMDEVIVTTSALSAGQIAALWNARND